MTSLLRTKKGSAVSDSRSRANARGPAREGDKSYVTTLLEAPTQTEEYPFIDPNFCLRAGLCALTCPQRLLFMRHGDSDSKLEGRSHLVMFFLI